MKKSHKENIVILLTATVNCKNVIFCEFNDPNLRKQQYLYSISYYLIHTNCKLVFTENSGYDITSDLSQWLSKNHNKNLKEFSNRLEIFTINNTNDSIKKGKGFGEAKILSYTMSNSKFITKDSYILKITGRVIINNIHNLLKILSKTKAQKIFRATYFYGGHLYSMVFFIDAESLKWALPYLLNSCDDKKSMFFEDVLNIALLKNNNIVIKPINIAIDYSNYQTATFVKINKQSTLIKFLFNTCAKIHCNCYRKQTKFWKYLYKLFYKLTLSASIKQTKRK